MMLLLENPHLAGKEIKPQTPRTQHHILAPKQSGILVDMYLILISDPSKQSCFVRMQMLSERHLLI